jgi:DNA-binding CsgD family transcriptional regulator
MGTTTHLSTDRPEDPGRDVLTPRELEVLTLVAESYTSAEIAASLVISPRTVDHHRANIAAKLGTHRQMDLLRYAIRRGLVAP